MNPDQYWVLEFKKSMKAYQIVSDLLLILEEINCVSFLDTYTMRMHIVKSVERDYLMSHCADAI